MKQGGEGGSDVWSKDRIFYFLIISIIGEFGWNTSSILASIVIKGLQCKCTCEDRDKLYIIIIIIIIMVIFMLNHNTFPQNYIFEYIYI